MNEAMGNDLFARIIHRYRSAGFDVEDVDMMLVMWGRICEGGGGPDQIGEHANFT